MKLKSQSKRIRAVLKSQTIETSRVILNIMTVVINPISRRNTKLT